MAGYAEARTKVTNEPGRLLWVCRRNGTWWPAQILSVDQVPERYMPSKRSGTPVKLLGKEDGSMEWYNMEKSKRIKPFRCSEFTECIEKVKASPDYLSSISAKYARREDAIRHALQLEGAQKLEDEPQHEMAELTGTEPRDIDAELVTTQRLLPCPEPRPFIDSRVGICDPLNLSEVKVEVQKICTPQKVPFTCAQSGLNGHSIVGHPLEVEALHDCFCHNLLSGVSKVSETSSSLSASEQNSPLQKINPEVQDLKKTFDRCVPVSRIFRHLKEALL